MRGTAELTVGVIGGMGPYATLAFLQCMLDNTIAQKDWDHVRTITDNNPKIPSRTRAFLYGEADPSPMMAESANALRDAGADFVVLPCNSAHYFLPRVHTLTDVSFINLVEETSRVIAASGAKVVGLLGGEVTVQGGLYEERLNPRGIEVLQVTGDEQKLVRSVIEDAKQNRVVESTFGVMEALIRGLASRGAQTVILGCTEFPLVMHGVNAGCATVDSMEVLARAAIRRATQLPGEMADRKA
jgi:aspartate racemase